jgi:succinate dehydrogenase hydrophobic anchor subunit
MSNKEHKIQKKLLKKEYKLEKKSGRRSTKPIDQRPPTLFVRFAESIRGILYIVLALSIITAVIMGQSGLILTIEDIIDSLIIARLGKVLILIIAVALFIYGLKNLRLLK